MAAILTRGDKYRVRWIWGGARGGPWQSLTCDTWEDAKIIRGMIEAEGHRLTRDQVIDKLAGKRAPVETVAGWLRAYIDSRPGISDATRREYLSVLNHQVKSTALGKMPLSAVTRDDAVAWVRNVEGVRSPKSIANYRALLSAAFSEAAISGRVTMNPFKGVRIPRRDDRTTASDHVFLTAAQVRAICSKMTAYTDVPDLLARTGLRWSELAALQVGDVDLDARTVTVARAWVRAADGSFVIGPPKTRKARRVIALDKAATKAVKARVAGRDASAWLVTAPNGRDPLKRATFAPYWVTAVVALVKDKKLPRRPRIHDLRHTHAAWLIAAGVPLPVIQARLGHESIQTTIDVYGHLLPETQKQVVAALDRL